MAITTTRMAVRIGLFCLVTYFMTVSSEFTNYDRSIPIQTKEDCNQAGSTREFYDVTTLECVPCSQNDTYQVASTDLLSCVCKVHYRYTLNHGGRAVTCAPCGPTQVASSTGFNCITCPAGTVVDNSTNTCRPCSGSNQITPERDLLGNWYTSGASNTIRCQNCTDDTQPGAENRCVKCVNVLPVTANNSCVCSSRNFTGGYCFPANQIVKDEPKLYEIPRTQSRSKYFEEHLRAAYSLCHNYDNITACELLGNLCVLTLYEYSSSSTSGTFNNACEMYYFVLYEARAFAPPNVPWLYYFTVSNNILESEKGNEILRSDYLKTQYTFSPPSKIEYRVARYSLSGEYLGLSNVENGRLQLCADTTNKLNAAYVFGTTYTQSCKVSALNLWDKSKYPLEFLDLYLEISQNDVPELYPIPVNILNYRSLDNGDSEINRGDEEDMQLFRRFFMVDNVATITAQSAEAEVVRFAQKMKISVNLVTDTTQGMIYPPSLEIEYGSVSLTEAQNGAEVDVEFSVEYTFTDTDYLQDFQIAVGTLSTLGVIFAGYRTWVWSKRSGRPTIDFPTIANFFFFVAGTLANVFFVITFGMAFYWFIFFKRQSVVYLVHPSDRQLRDWLGLFGSAFALKFLEVAHMIFMQCMTDVFFIDWERSKGNTGTDTKSKEIPVSIWRTYFVANEWNEIQAVRKINKTFQVWAAVFFLVVVGFENTATMDPDGRVVKDSADYKAAYSRVYRYAVAVLVYLVTGIVQWIFFTFIYERFFEDKVRQFVDLCSMSNISVFVMANAQYGHYIHGRSVHGKADTNMREMFEMMKKEEEDMCGQRGLLPNTEQQTFIMALPKKLRMKYETVLLPAQLESAQAAASHMDAGRGRRIAGTAMEKQVEAYTVINRFLSSFIDRSLKDMDYVIKDKTFLESVMDTEFYDTQETGIFYNDDGHSFDNVLFYGNEMTLLLFDILTFCIVDLIFTNFVVAGVVTYLLSEVVCIARDAGGQKNLAKKTLVDERFLI